MWCFYYTKYGYFVIPLVEYLSLALFKYAEYGLDNPPNNHECELYETYQYVTAKHYYQESAQKYKHVLLLFIGFAYFLCSVSAFSVIV